MDFDKLKDALGETEQGKEVFAQVTKHFQNTTQLQEDMKSLTKENKSLSKQNTDFTKKISSFEEELNAKTIEGDSEAAKQLSLKDKQLKLMNEKLEKNNEVLQQMVERERNLAVSRDIDSAFNTANINPSLREGALALIKTQNDIVMDESDGEYKIGGKPIKDFVKDWTETSGGSAYVAINTGGGALGSGFNGFNANQPQGGAIRSLVKQAMDPNT